MKALKTSILSGLFLTLTACSTTFFVDVAKRSSNTIMFCFYKDSQRSSQVTKTITRLSVLEEENNDWVPVWMIEGPVTSACIDYGFSTNGVETKTTALHLEPGRHYKVLIADNESPIGYASLNFSLRTDGSPSID